MWLRGTAITLVAASGLALVAVPARSPLRGRRKGAAGAGSGGGGRGGGVGGVWRAWITTVMRTTDLPGAPRPAP